MNIGFAIKQCRKTKHFTQSDLSKRSKLSISYISLLERNKRDPNISVLEVISKALDVPVPILIFLAAEKNDLPELGEDLTRRLKKLAFKVVGDVK